VQNHRAVASASRVAIPPKITSPEWIDAAFCADFGENGGWILVTVGIVALEFLAAMWICKHDVFGPRREWNQVQHISFY
jgi:hypothetical protein